MHRGISFLAILCTIALSATRTGASCWDTLSRKDIQLLGWLYMHRTEQQWDHDIQTKNCEPLDDFLLCFKDIDTDSVIKALINVNRALDVSCSHVTPADRELKQRYEGMLQLAYHCWHERASHTINGLKPEIWYPEDGLWSNYNVRR